jgi:hypothetical protein
MSKLEYAQQLIKDTVASKPIIAMSFGKDSMVMLDIFIRMGLTLPVVYWRRERHFPLKNQFANKVIEKFNLVAYDFPPIATRLIRGKGLIEVVNYFTVSDSLKTLAIPSGIAPVVEGEPYLCALEDMYNKPKGVCEFYWDTVYIGHKDSDIDPLQGAVPLTCDEFTLDKGPRLCFPLRHFTDDDIWEYSKTYEVMQDTNRYKSDGDEDMTYNNDYYPACTACINPDNPASVWCPKVNRNIENVSSKLNWVESIRPAYWKEQ